MTGKTKASKNSLIVMRDVSATSDRQHEGEEVIRTNSTFGRYPP